MPFQKKIISLLAYKLTRAEEIRASVTKEKFKKNKDLKYTIREQ